MANRYFTQFKWSMEKNPATLWARVTFGVSGAPTLDGINSKGIKSITRASAGKYDVTFGVGQATDIYNRLFLVRKRFLKSTPPAAPLMYVSAEDVLHGTLQLQFLAPNSTTPTDPASGEEVWIQFGLKTSTAA